MSTVRRFIFDDDEIEDIDGDLDEMMANLDSVSIQEACQGQNSIQPSLRRDVWKSLSTEDQFAWDKLSDRGKLAVILDSSPTETKKEKGNIFHQPYFKENFNETFNEDEEEFLDANDMDGIVDDAVEALIIHSASRRSNYGGTNSKSMTIRPYSEFHGLSCVQAYPQLWCTS